MEKFSPVNVANETSMLSYTAQTIEQLAKDLVGTRLTKKQRDNISAIVSNANHLRSRLDNINDLAAQEVGIGKK